MRAFRDGDASDLLRAFSDPEVLWWLDEPFTLDAARAWIARARGGYERSGMGLYAVCLRDGARLIGDCGLVVQTVDGLALVEIGWHLERGAWGRGYATEAARVVLSLARRARRPRVTRDPDARDDRPDKRLPAAARAALMSSFPTVVSPHPRDDAAPRCLIVEKRHIVAPPLARVYIASESS